MNYSKNLGVALHSIFGNEDRMNQLRSTKVSQLNGAAMAFVCGDGIDLTDKDVDALLSIVRGFLREERWAQCGE
jgi:hypothetical protein